MFRLLEFVLADAYIDEEGLIVGEHTVIHASSDLMAVMSYVTRSAYGADRHGKTFKVLLETKRADGRRSVVVRQEVFPSNMSRFLTANSETVAGRAQLHWLLSPIAAQLRENTIRRRGVDPGT